MDIHRNGENEIWRGYSICRHAECVRFLVNADCLIAEMERTLSNDDDELPSPNG